MVALLVPLAFLWVVLLGMNLIDSGRGTEEYSAPKLGQLVLSLLDLVLLEMSHIQVNGPLHCESLKIYKDEPKTINLPWLIGALLDCHEWDRGAVIFHEIKLLRHQFYLRLLRNFFKCLILNERKLRL